MSWNKNFVVVLNADEPDYPTFFDGFKYEPTTKSAFNNISNKNFSTVSVGYIDCHIFLTVPEYAGKMYGPKVSEFEMWLTDKYPRHEILSLMEDGSAGCFGFTLIKSGERIRAISGCDGEIYFDFGPPLPIEKTLHDEVLNRMDNGEKEEFLEEGQQALDDFVKFESKWRMPYSFALRNHTIDMEAYSDRNPEFEVYK